MPFQFTCHRCQKQMNLADNVAGKRFKCAGCGEILHADVGPPRAAGTQAAAADSPPVSAKAKNVQRRPATFSEGEIRQRRRSSERTSEKQRSRSQQQSQKPRKKRQGRPPADEFEDFYDDGFGSYGAPVKSDGKKRKTKKQNRGQKRVYTEEFKKIIREIAIFFIGFGLIVGCFTLAAWFTLWTPEERQAGNHRAGGMLLLARTAGVFVAMGILTLTRLTPVLWLLRVCSLLFGLATLGFWFSKVVLLISPITIAFFFATARYGAAIKASRN